MAENALVRLFGREAATRRRNELAANFAPDPTPIRNRIADHRAQVDATLGGTTLQNRLAMLGSTGVPGLSDVAGLAADAMGYAGDPSSRTPVNYGLSALGLLPFVPGMTAYHGTPHRFAPEPDAPLGKFRMEKLGTGEGAQAYGHGMYFAESPDVARQYRSTLTSTAAKGDDNGAAYNFVAKFNGDEDYAKEILAQQIEAMRANGSPNLDTAVGMLRSINDGSYKSHVPPTGAVYHVDIPDEQIDQMLDYDSPLSQQSEVVRNALKRRITEVKAIDGLDLGNGTRLRDNRHRQADPDQAQPWVMEATSGNGVSRFGLSQADVDRLVGAKDAKDLTGGQIYTRLAAEMGGQEKASAFLASLGIPGIRYLDGVSRKAGEGSRNFVVFEPEKLKVLKRE